MATDAQQVFTALHQLASQERVIHVKFLRTLNTLEQSKLYAERGYSSAFAYLTKALKLSESYAAKRLRAARACRRFPVIYTMLERGQLHMSHVSLLAHHLNESNHEHLLSAAVHKPKATVEAMVAALKPEGAVRERVRFVARPVVATVSAKHEAFSQPTTVPAAAPNSPASSKTANGEKKEAPVPATIRFETKVNLAFDIDAGAFCDLKRVRALLSHKYPEGKLEDIFAELVSFYLAKKDPLRVKGKSKNQSAKSEPKAKPKGRSRYIPAAIKREVFQRDQGQCTYVAPDGRRCNSRHFIEIDHIRPYSLGGVSDDASNLRLVCKAHNQWLGRALGAMSIRK